MSINIWWSVGANNWQQIVAVSLLRCGVIDDWRANFQLKFAHSLPTFRPKLSIDLSWMQKQSFRTTLAIAFLTCFKSTPTDSSCAFEMRSYSASIRIYDNCKLFYDLCVFMGMVKKHNGAIDILCVCVCAMKVVGWTWWYNMVRTGFRMNELLFGLLPTTRQ